MTERPTRFDYSDVQFSKLDLHDRRTTALYVIESEPYVKIGLASDPAKRLMSLFCSNPHSVRFIVGYYVPMACATRGAKFQLEMGGKNPLVVLDDANLDTAVAAALDGAFFQTGQRCTASSRLIVQAKVHDAFVERMVDGMKKLKVDHALKDGTVIGPVG